MLEPEIKETVIGHAEVRATFHISKLGNIAGCLVTVGEIRRNAYGRVRRGGDIIHEGSISSLRHLQEMYAKSGMALSAAWRLKISTNGKSGMS